MNWLKYVLSRRYRTHKWVARNLHYYRLQPNWLARRRMQRLWSMMIRDVRKSNLIFAGQVERDYSGLREGETIYIPKLGELGG